MRSGLPMAREVAFQVCSSMTFICAAPSRPCFVSICSSGSWPGSSAGSSRLHAGNLAVLHVLLEEQLAAHALGRAHQRHRPAAQVRQHEPGHAVVVGRELALGDAAVHVDHAVGVGDLLGHGGALSLSFLRPLAADVARGLVGAQALKDGLAHAVFARPFAE